MIFFLLCFGMVVTPFFVLPGLDSRLPKEAFSLGVALSVVLLTFLKGGFKPFKNYWILLFLLFSYFSILFSPPFKDFMLAYKNGNTLEILVNRPIANLWMFKAEYYFLIYFLFMIVVASFEFKSNQIKTLLFLIPFCGFIMSLFIFIQEAGLDPFFSKVTQEYNPDVNHLDKPLIGGFMGQATLVSTFIAASIPIAVFLKRYFWVLCCLLALYFCESKTAWIALYVGMLLYFFSVQKRFHKSIGIVLVATALCFSTFWFNKCPFYDAQSLNIQIGMQANGRVNITRQIIDFFITSIEGTKRTFWGIGPGSFHYVFSTIKNNQWWEAHNDPAEFLINFGIPGLGIIFMAVLFMVNLCGIKNNAITPAIYSSLLILFITSLGTFSMQLSPNIVNACILVGLLHNKIFIDDFDYKI